MSVGFATPPAHVADWRGQAALGLTNPPTPDQFRQHAAH
jgi:hypothetical protein